MLGFYILLSLLDLVSTPRAHIRVRDLIRGLETSLFEQIKQTMVQFSAMFVNQLLLLIQASVIYFNFSSETDSATMCTNIFRTVSNSRQM